MSVGEVGSLAKPSVASQTGSRPDGRRVPVGDGGTCESRDKG